jgi:hypothetical protein
LELFQQRFLFCEIMLTIRFPWQQDPPLSSEETMREFVAYLGEAWPHWRVEEASPGELEMRDDEDHESTLCLHKLHYEVQHVRRNTPKTRRKIYETFARKMLAPENSIPPIEEISRADYEERIFPRFVENSFFEAVRERTGVDNVPRRTFADGINVVYVLDFPERVAYILSDQAEQLGMSEDELYEAGIANLRKIFPREAMRPLVEKTREDEIAALPCPDGHNAARLLIACEYLEDGEEVAVVLRDDSHFVVLPVPPNNNWNPLRELARTGHPSGQRQPFLLSAQGVKAM